MKIKQKTIEELKRIIEKDYGVLLSDSELNELGSSLLHLTKLSLVALARADERNSSFPARVNNTLESNTSE
jgi:hypothetical protein